MSIENVTSPLYGPEPEPMSTAAGVRAGFTGRVSIERTEMSGDADACACEQRSITQIPRSGLRGFATIVGPESGPESLSSTNFT